MVYTVEEVAKILRVSTATVRRLLKAGEIEGFPVGNQWRVTQEALDKYMRKQTK